jgi:single-stranded DNA-specific DHH superfamily exonuclease
MLDDRMTRRRIGDLEQALKRERAEARKVSIQLLAASLNPLSNARTGLKARHAALLKLVDETQAEIERRRPPQGGMPAS